MVETPPLAGEEEGRVMWSRETIQVGAHTKHDLKVHLVWVPKYRKKVLTGQVALRGCALIRQIVMEHEVTILSGKVASGHIHVLVAYRPHVDVSMIVQWLKGISSRILLQEFVHLRKQFWGRHLWARGYLAVRTGNLTDEMVRQYIEEQEGEPVHDDSRWSSGILCVNRCPLREGMKTPTIFHGLGHVSEAAISGDFAPRHLH